MSREKPLDPTLRFFLIAASLVIIVAGLRAAAPVMLPVLVAFFLCVLSVPLLAALIRLGVRPVLAVLATIFVSVLVVTAFGILARIAVGRIPQALPGYSEALVGRAIALQELLEARGVRVSEFLTPDKVDPGAIVGVGTTVARNTLRSALSGFTFGLLVVFTMIFMLIEATGFRTKLLASAGNSGLDISRFTAMAREVQHYLAMKTLISAATGVLVGTWTWILGLDFPLLWGLLAFALNYIPTVGSIIAGIPATLLGVIQYGFGRAGLVALGYVVINLVLGNLVEPNLMGRRFGMSALMIFLSLLFWGWVWGPIGALLSVPLTVMLKIMLEHSGEFRWLAVIMGRVPKASAAAGETWIARKRR